MTDSEPPIVHVHDHTRAVRDSFCEDDPRDERLDLPLEIPLERACSEDGIIASLGNKVAGSVGQLKDHPPPGQAGREVLNLKVHDASDLVPRQ